MKIKCITALTFLMVLISSCGINNGSTVSNNEAIDTNNGENGLSENTVSSDQLFDLENGEEVPVPIVYSLSGNMVLKISKYDQLVTYNKNTATVVEGVDGEVNVSGQGVIVDNNTINLMEGGTYILRGELVNKSIYVNIPADKKIHLILDGVTITSDVTAPINGAYGDKMIITLSENTVNMITDSKNHVNDAANGCLYSTMDTTINGTGELTINGNYNNGIAVKNDLKIYGTTLNINAVNNGIKGNNSVSIIDSNVVISAKDDGVKSSEEEDKTKGFIFVSNSTVEVTAEDDVMQAPRAIVIRDNGLVRGRSYGSMLNCKGGYIEGEEYTSTWE